MRLLFIDLVNGKTAKLIRRFASHCGKSPRTLRKQWGRTPKLKREALRRWMMDEIGTVTFAQEIAQWREDNELLLKEAAGILGVTMSTFTNWEYDHHEPTRFARAELRRLMSAYHKP